MCVYIHICVVCINHPTLTPPTHTTHSGGTAVGSPTKTGPLGLASPTPSTPAAGFKSPGGGAVSTPSSSFLTTPGGSVLAAASVGSQFKQQVSGLFWCGVEGCRTPHILPTFAPSSRPLTLTPTPTKHQTQLLALMGQIHKTRPHYIRCLKPNDQNVPDALDRARLTEQLRYGGVLEAVRKMNLKIYIY